MIQVGCDAEINTPSLRVFKEPIFKNAQLLNELAKPRGVSIWGVTKGLCGDCEIGHIFMAGGCRGLADSRLANIYKLSRSGMKCDFLLLRSPAPQEAGEELDHIKPIEGRPTHMMLHLVIPVALLIIISVGSFFILGGVKILEAFFVVIAYQAILMSVGGYFKSVRDFMEVTTNGIKAVMPAVFILALAYCINTISKGLGAQQFVIDATKGWMTPTLLPAITFFTGACISFFTGTSWGTYALLVPLSMPIAFSLSGGEAGRVVLVTIASIMGGGVFGDHCSPVSDTTCLSSFGAASDHMDHVVTQLPYALSCALASLILYLALGATT
jgi:Na+/H+ antiporter NhaC